MQSEISLIKKIQKKELWKIIMSKNHTNVIYLIYLILLVSIYFIRGKVEGNITANLYYICVSSCLCFMQSEISLIKLQKNMIYTWERISERDRSIEFSSFIDLGVEHSFYV